MKRFTGVIYNITIIFAIYSIASYFDPSGQIINLPGLIVVFVGTLGATTMGQSGKVVFSLLRRLPALLKASPTTNEVDIALFVKIADFYRLGNIRYAELGARRLESSLLRSGTLLVLDRVAATNIDRTMQWKIGAQRERDNSEIQVFRTMMTLAPAFGMLGTLFGLISMLYGLDDGAMQNIGQSMGFAMLTTVYGLLASNLLFKPIIARLEANSRRRLAWMFVQVEAVMMMEEKCHSTVIQEAMLAFLDNPEISRHRDELELTAVRM